MPCHLLWSSWASCHPCGLWLIWPLLPQDPGSGAAPSAPAPYSRASVESSGKALRGKCLSDVGPEITLCFTTLITSCLDSQFCFRNERLLLPFTFSTTQGQPFASASQKTWRLDEGPGMEKVRGSLAGQQARAPAWGREGKGAAVEGPVHPFSGSRAHTCPLLRLTAAQVVTTITAQAAADSLFAEQCHRQAFGSEGGRPQARREWPPPTRPGQERSPGRPLMPGALETGTAVSPVGNRLGLSQLAAGLDPEPGPTLPPRTPGDGTSFIAGAKRKCGALT